MIPVTPITTFGQTVSQQRVAVFDALISANVEIPTGELGASIVFFSVRWCCDRWDPRVQLSHSVRRPGLDPGTLGLKGTFRWLLRVGLVSLCCRNMRPKMSPVWERGAIFNRIDKLRNFNFRASSPPTLEV
jgi:hypothetical protein